MHILSVLSPRKGDILRFERMKFYLYRYSHFGIASGYRKMIHLDIEPGHLLGFLSGKGIVKEDDIDDVEGIAFIDNLHDSFLPSSTPDETVSRAKDRLGKSSYNFLTYNCEHFASEMKYNLPLSSQISPPPWQPDEVTANLYWIPLKRRNDQFKMVTADDAKSPPKDNVLSFFDQEKYETKPHINTVEVESKREQCKNIKNVSISCLDNPFKQFCQDYTQENVYENETLFNSCHWLRFPADTQQNVSTSCLDFKQFCHEYTQEDQSSTWWNRSCKKILLEDAQHNVSISYLDNSFKKFCLDYTQKDQSSTWWNRSCKKILLEDAQHDLCAMLRDKLCMDNLHHNVSFPWFDQSCNGFSLSGTQQNSSMMFMDDICMVDPDHYLSKKWSKVDLQHNSSMMFMDDLCMVDPDHDLSKKLRVHPWTVDLKLESKNGNLESGSWERALSVCLFIVFGVSALKLICFGFDLLGVGEKLRPQREQRRRQTDQQEKDDIYLTEEDIGNIDYTILHKNVIHV